MKARRADILVIGGGVVGLSVAYFAALEGARVVVLEKGEVGAGSSSGNAGLLVPSYFEPLPSPGVIGEALRNLLRSQGFFGLRPRLDPYFLLWLVRFARSCNKKDFEAHSKLLAELNRKAMEIHLDFANAGGEAYEFNRRGLLFLYLKRARWVKAKERARKAGAFGLRTKILSGEEVRAVEPAAGEGVVGGIRYFSDAALNPLRFMAWLAKRVSASGADIVMGCEVYGFHTSGRRVASVLTTCGEFQGEQVVLAAGAWLGDLGCLLGVRLPVEGGKGVSQTFSSPLRSVVQPLILDEYHVAVSPMAGALRVTGLLELGGTDLRLDARRINGVREAASLYLPNLKSVKPDEVWRGLRPCTPDGLPLLGKLKAWNNVLVAGGHDTKGMTLGPLSGLLAARILSGRSRSLDYEKALSPRRFGA